MSDKVYSKVPDYMKLEPAENTNPPVFWGECRHCGGSINIHSVIFVEPNEACETFEFCSFETGNDPTDGSTFCRYIVLTPEKADTMDREEFEELYG